MSFTDARTVPVDPTSAERLAAQHLVYRMIDTASEPDATSFLRADARGFLDPDPADDEVEAGRALLKLRRNIGVFEADAAVGDLPVATVNSWGTPLTVPGGELGMWAISSVTVAGTHRRRGIARALLEGELRAAASGGFALAGLTVSEATIYSRYGFGAALPVARMKIDTRRAGWLGGAPEGRLDYIDRETLKDALGVVHEVARTQRSGQIAGWESRWARAAGLAPGVTAPTAVRGVRFRDAAGDVQGVMAYRLVEIPGAFRFRLEVVQLTTTTDEALRALWGFAIQHDLVDEVTADLRPIDDPLPWLIVDQRAVTVTVHDHGWLRILDVPAALGARTYRAPLDLVLRVEDSLGFAEGAWRLRVADGRAELTEASPDDADVTLDISALSILFAGGVQATTLRAAGRLSASAEVAARLDDAFRAAEAPLLGIWY